MANPDDVATKAAATARRGSIVAAAGCGKTEQIALATKLAEGRRLILTHTHAGVDAIRARLAKLDVPSAKFRVDTIAGWSLRYAASFPKTSGLRHFDPRADAWNDVYGAADALLRSGAVDQVLTQSYEGVFVDEYQDCDQAQHQIVTSLSETLPTCVFGDPLQAIFDFGGAPVDWNSEVERAFPPIGELTQPHRWLNAGNNDMALWLVEVRNRLLAGGTISNLSRPPCVEVTHIGDHVGPTAKARIKAKVRAKAAAVHAACRKAHNAAGDRRVVVIGEEANLGQRQNLAMNLAQLGFSNIEAVDCKPLYALADTLDAEPNGLSRLTHLLSFAEKCMNGLGPADLTKAVMSHLAGGKLGRTRYGSVIGAALRVVSENSDDATSKLLEELRSFSGARLYCRERYSALQRAIERKARTGCSLKAAVWDVQNQGRHAGRKIGRRSVGSTLLVKGLEFERVVLIHHSKMSSSDLYVAVTRAVDGLEIISG